MQLGLLRAQACWIDRHWQHVLQDDLDAGKLADDLGFSEAYFAGTPTGEPADLNPSTILAVKLADATHQLRIGIDSAMLGAASARSLAQSISLLDQLLDGRLFLGVLPVGESGRIKSSHDMENRADVPNLLGEVLECWRDNVPDGPRRTTRPAEGRHRSFDLAIPLQQPHPMILALPRTGGCDEVATAATDGFRPVSASWLSQRDVAAHWPALVAGATRGGKWACPSHWRVARSIFICDDQHITEAYVKGPRSPYRKYYEAVLRRTGGDRDLDQLLDDVVISGPASQVADRLCALQALTGDIGTLLYVDHVWADRDLARSSLIQMAEKVMPAVQPATIRHNRELEHT